jgi:hypothetical protein
MALGFSVNTKSRYGLHVGTEFLSTKCGKNPKLRNTKTGEFMHCLYGAFAGTAKNEH